VNLELNYVKRLGWFIEIEILCQPKDIKKARKKIIEVRDKLELNKKYIEKKGYTKALWDLKRISI